MLNKYKNNSQKSRVSGALELITNESDQFFVGDEMLVLNKSMHFMDDEDFVKLFEQTARSPHYKGMAWRLHNLIYAAKHALSVEGDFIECGVFIGFKSYFLINYLRQSLATRKYYLLDTFEGIDENLSKGSPIKQVEHRKARLFEFIKHRFKPFENVCPIQGSVPASLHEIDVNRVAFLHLDMNSYQAELGALDFLWEKIPTGGVILLDDFGLKSHSAQMEAELPWFHVKNQNVLELPTGQALVIKT